MSTDCESSTGGGSKTISEFCKDHRISRSFYYKLKRAGLGPREMRYFETVRITPAAEREWMERGEQRAREIAPATKEITQTI